MIKTLRCVVSRDYDQNGIKLLQDGLPITMEDDFGDPDQFRDILEPERDRVTVAVGRTLAPPHAGSRTAPSSLAAPIGMT